MAILLIATGMVCILLTARTWIATHDIYHPMMLFAPVLIYLYVVQPALLITSAAWDAYFTQEQLLQIQAISILGVIALLLGASQTKIRVQQSLYLQGAPNPRRHKRLRQVAIAIGCIGLGLWFKTLANVGGFQSAFGQAYGSGWSDSGYMRQLSLDVPFAAILLMSYYCGLTSAKISNVLLAVAFGFPLLTQALLGARRGPTFMLVVVCFCAFDLARGRRPKLTKGLLVGGFVAVLLLLLITNRGSIYIGSTQSIDPGKIGSYFQIGPGSEYVVGGAEILHTWDTGQIPWGTNWLAEVVVRPIPHEVWPTKWDDWAAWTGSAVISATFHSGSAETVGWKVSVGSPPGVVAETFAEWSWLSFPVLWCIGRLYAMCWAKARARQGNWPVYYTVCATLSIYVTAQGPLDTIYRFPLIIGILALILRFSKPAKIKSRGWLIPGRNEVSIAEASYHPAPSGGTPWVSGPSSSHHIGLA